MSTIAEMRDLAERTKKMRPPVCAHRRCKRPPTQAHDVLSWFHEVQYQTPAHYEACDRHAHYFEEPFDRTSSEAIEKDLVEWATLNGTAIEARRALYERTLQFIASTLKGSGSDAYKFQHVTWLLADAGIQEEIG